MQRRDARIGERGHVLRVELESLMQRCVARIGERTLVLRARARLFRTFLRIDAHRPRHPKRSCADESFFPHDLVSSKVSWHSSKKQSNIAVSYSYVRVNGT